MSVSPVQIGDLHIEYPVFLAPMAGVTDFPFRVLCKEQGAGLVYSEFVSAQGVIRGNLRTLDMMKFTHFERPIGIQIFGDDPQVMGSAARFIADRFAPDIIDINYGCPVPKITKKGAGSAALKDLYLMEDITRSVVESVPEIAVTVKMRAGWDSNSIVVPGAGERLENCGIKAITLHPRTTKQDFHGTADWSLIKALKVAVSIPVIGNGDIRTAVDAQNMLTETGCDAVMIGRAALGNPWIFQAASALIKNNSPPRPPSMEESVNMCRRHLDLLIQSRGERTGLNLMRKHFGWYFKGFPGAANLRKALVTAPGIKEINKVFTELLSIQT